MRTTIVKLGGSVITRKREESSLRPKVLTRLAGEIQAGLSRPDDRVIVLHGAGSFGHPFARKWNLSEPPAPADRDRARGAAITSYHVRELHQAVLKSLLAAGLDPFSLPPQSLATNDGGRLVDFPRSRFEQTLESGSVPVSFGDVVQDRTWGFSILSADDIALELVRSGHIDRVVFVSDVPGILDGGKPPRPVAQLTPQLVETLRPSPGVPDVTRGIRGKAEKMLAIAATGTPCVLLNGLSQGRLTMALQGEKVYGTWT